MKPGIHFANKQCTKISWQYVHDPKRHETWLKGALKTDSMYAVINLCKSSCLAIALHV